MLNYMSKNNVFRWRKGMVLSATFLFLFFVGLQTSGCKKKDNLLGGKAIDQNDLLNSGGVDTFSLITYTIAEDTVYTRSPRYGLLGILNDPEFGIVDVGFYTQIRLSGLNPNFGNTANITVDSFVLALEYVGGYGYFGNQTFEVYELDQQMSLDSSYRSTQDLALKSENWVDGTGTLQVNPQGITVVGGDTVTTQLRIPLKPAKALQIMQDASNFPAEFGNNSLFMSNYFKGLYVKTNGIASSQNTGMVGYFNLLDQDTKIIIYYKEDGVAKPAFDLVMNNECATYNRFKFNSSGKRIESVIADSTLGQVEFYAQAGKHRAVISFPTLKHLPKNIVIHNAKLHLPIQHLAGSKFSPPSSVSLTMSGVSAFAPVVAEYDPYTKGYVADIRAYVQNYSTGAITEETLTVSPGTSFISTADRIVFNGQATDKKMKPRLIISYTEF